MIFIFLVQTNEISEIKIIRIAGTATLNAELLDAVVICWKLRRGDKSYGKVPEARARCQKLGQGVRSCGNFFNFCFHTELHQTETSELKKIFKGCIIVNVYWYSY